MAAVTGDAGVDAASRPLQSRRLSCGAARAREHAARGVPRPALCRLGSPGAGAPHCPLVWRGGGEDPEGDEPPRRQGLKTTATERQRIGKEALSHEDYGIPSQTKTTNLRIGEAASTTYGERLNRT
ncbi:hypothetical protein NDU88_008889 [Pleurodeles waltl]|uniref:Uncharacterized protein n=1 Tax=Pleurodeles waltl TaxID=8319 RepID=A0AAV7RW08_PLEWA|nr:hypothetical protein NDU88_008889 [Pleurodeles waltl]